MNSFTDWSPPALVGILFTVFAGAKLYGRSRGIVGGGGKPWSQRCLGSCPTWNRQMNTTLLILFLVVGIINLVWAGLVIMH